MSARTTPHVALVRAINVGGRNVIAMAGLKTMLTDLGFEAPRTLLQSGNLVFGSAGRSPAEIEALLADETGRRFGFAPDYFVRTAPQWADMIERNPFAEAARTDPGHLLVMVLRDAVSKESLAALRAAITGRETVEAHDRHAYFVYPDGIGRSRLTTAIIEKALGTRGTGRNWNTLGKVRALCER